MNRGRMAGLRGHNVHYDPNPKMRGWIWFGVTSNPVEGVAGQLFEPDSTHLESGGAAVFRAMPVIIAYRPSK